MANNNVNKMGNPHQLFWQEIGQFFGKWLSYILLISAGVVARITFNSRNKDMTKKQIAIAAILGAICGSLCSYWCINTGNVKMSIYLVPVVTIAGQEIIGFIVLNANKILDKILKFFTPGNGK